MAIKIEKDTIEVINKVFHLLCAVFFVEVDYVDDVFVVVYHVKKVLLAN